MPGSPGFDDDEFDLDEDEEVDANAELGPNSVQVLHKLWTPLRPHLLRDAEFVGSRGDVMFGVEVDVTESRRGYENLM